MPWTRRRPAPRPSCTEGGGMRLLCPFCGLRDEGEFAYEGDASVVYPPVEADADAWHDAVYLRDQPRGRVRELWR
ncbi:MAG: sarcosine oxidase subunit delta, partial [Pseudomonadota bacterium]